MPEKVKRRAVENRGTAIILSLIIVTVLFILTSFLIRKVVTNTMMVRKAKEEQESYAKAKQGILYALDKLNTWDGTDPDYDPTDWPGTGNRNWIELDLDNKDEDSDVTTGDKECRIRVDKDDLPPNVFVSPDPNDDSNYLTIESQDLPKKLVTLEAITENSSPLLSYVRFINSDTVFGNDFFGQTGTLIQGDAPLCILGNVTWASASSNNLILNGYDSKAIIYGTISNGGVSSLQINGALPQDGFYYFFDPNDSSYDDPAVFDTAYGRYFSSAHLPSCYGYSSGPPTFYDGSTQVTLWPQIKKDRYQNLASGVNCYLNNPDEINKEAEWSDPSNDNTANDNDTITEWLRDGEGSTYPTVVTTSYHYYPYAARLILNNTDVSEQLSDGTVNIIDYSSITNNIIFAEGDISVSGIIPSGENLTIASAGNIFIDSNLLKEANSASLALLAKQDIVLNPTLRYGMDTGNSSSNESWYYPDYSLGNPDVTNHTSPTVSVVTLEAGEKKIYTLDIDLGRAITGGRIVLWNYEDADSVANLETELEVWVTRQESPPGDSSSWDQEVLPFEDVPTGDSFNIDFTPRTFRWIRLNLWAHNTYDINPYDFDLSKERLDAVEIPFYGIDAALFAEEGSLKVVTGGGVDQNDAILPRNHAYQPDASGPKIPSDSGTSDRRLFFWGTLAEDEWTGAVSGWDYLSYVFDSNLLLNSPPSLPPSVNLASLKRK